MKKSNPIWILVIIVIFILLILNITLSTKIFEQKKNIYDDKKTKKNDSYKKISLQSTCPDSVGGNNQSYLRIKYFYSDFCPWCIKEEPILQKLVEEYGNLVYIEWFGTGFCSEKANRYKVSGVPTFVFSVKDEDKEYSHYGFIYEKDLRKLICDVTGGC